MLSRRDLFHILPVGGAACAGCAALSVQPEPGHSWTEKADMTWEDIFRFAFQKDFIPILKALGQRIGQDKLLTMLEEIGRERAGRGMAARGADKRDLSTWVSNIKQMPPMYQHALVAEILEDTPQAFGFRVSKCLWAKAFRGENAGDIGYACVCSPDFAVARAYNPKLKLNRTKTLMQGQDCCEFRYVMEA